MYQSPIDKIYGDIETQIVKDDEQMTLKAIQKVGIYVDKEELVKALNYDRNQYKSGFEDGKQYAIDKMVDEINKIIETTYHDCSFYRYVSAIDVFNILNKLKNKEVY